MKLFKRLRNLKNLDHYEPEDFEQKEKTILEKSKALKLNSDASIFYKKLEETGFFEKEEFEILKEKKQEYLPKDDSPKYFLELTERQLLDLFNLKRFFQDQLGVHYDSGWDILQCPQFIDDVIRYVTWYWDNWKIKEYLERQKNNQYLPKDFRKKVQDRDIVGEL